jgi:autotransporter-associated beta strand protein
MSLYPWLSKHSKTRRSRSKLRRDQTFRPCLEALEERLVLDTRIWSGGDPFSSNWSALFNWQNGAISLPSNPVRSGDSVDFPANAGQRSNVQDLPRLTRFDAVFFLTLDNLHIEGGDYDIEGVFGTDFTGKLTSDSGDNTIGDFLVYVGNQVGNDTATIDVGSGSLSLTNLLTSITREVGATFPAADLVKTGAGTLKVSAPIGTNSPHDTVVVVGEDTRFNSFIVQEGLVSLDAGGQLFVDTHVEDGGTLRLHENEQILGSFGRAPQIPDLAIDAGGLLDLNGHNQSAGEVTLSGGQITTGSGGTFKLRGELIAGGSATSSRIDGHVSLSGDRIFGVANGTATDDLVINGAIDGTVRTLTKIGAGQFAMSGSSPNSYTGTTFVNEGNLKLNKPDNVLAVVGALIVGDGLGGVNADRVVLFNDGQIAQNAFVRVNSSGLLALNGHTNALDGLTLAGGNVSSGTLGLLTMAGDVISESAPTLATISGHVSIKNVRGIGQLAEPRFFDVAGSVAGTDLLVSAVIEDGSLTKTGAGTMELTALSPTSGDTIVNQGILLVNGALSNSLLRLSSGVLRGNGSVNGISATDGAIQPGDGVGTLTSTGDVTLQSAVSLQPEVSPLSSDPHDVLKVQGAVNLAGASLAVRPVFQTSVAPSTPRVIDDGDAGFTATPGFGAHGAAGSFGNDVHVAGAGKGAEQASWTFNNLTPGSYRVSATWPASSFRTTNAPYTILDGATPVTTLRVNQQKAPADFPAGGVVWDILGVVQITGTSLTVLLTNDCDGSVIADAIQIDPHQMVIVDNDGTDAVQGTFAGLAERAQFGVVARSGTQQQTQFYTISYRANDGNDVGLAYVTTATAAADLRITPASINEGQSATLTGHLTDPDNGDFLTLTIDWGDGHKETHHPGTANFQFAHRYANNPAGQPHGAYTVHLTWFDQHNAGNSRDLTVTVNNVAPTIFLPAEISVRPSGLLVVAGHFTDPGVNDHWTATVDYGDGTGVQPLELNPTQRLLLHHRYQRPGTYSVTVTITDDAGESTTVALLVHVGAMPPHP